MRVVLFKLLKGIIIYSNYIMEDPLAFKMENMFIIKPDKIGTFEIFFCGEYERRVTTREEAEHHINQCLNMPYHLNRLKDNILKRIDSNLFFINTHLMVNDNAKTCYICGICWRGQYTGSKHEETQRHKHNMKILIKVDELLKQPQPNIEDVLRYWNHIRARNRLKSRL